MSERIRRLMACVFIIVWCSLSVALLAESPDLKRNQKVQSLASKVLKAQSAYDAEMKAWIAECGAKGLDLRPVAGNIMDCVARPAAPQQPPRPTPAKPEAK